MDLSEIENRLLTVFKKADQLLPKSELHEMAQLVRAGEPGIALENFCTQLLEYDVTAPDCILTEIAELGSAMGIQPRYWERLKNGPTG